MTNPFLTDPAVRKGLTLELKSIRYSQHLGERMCPGYTVFSEETQGGRA